MARRKEVFQSKVLQKFYPPPKPEKERDLPQTTETLARKTHAVKRKTSGEDALHEREPSTSSRCRRVYTVLPPPPDYDIQSRESVTLPQLHGINSAEDPAEKKVQELSEDSDEETEEEEEEQKRRRRRKKKRKAAPHSDSGRDGEALGSQTPAEEGGERLSRNKKRKLKKKRHKEKLLAMGLVPRAAAVEFTYQRDAEEEEEEEEKDDERKAAEVSDFLRTTTELYMSDSSSHPVRVSGLSATVDELLDRLASGTRPVCVLRLLDQLKAFAQRGEAGRLEKALEEVRGGSLLSAEENAAVASLFQYWITDILPLQRDGKTKLSPTGP